ncbi:MAG: hypothetical protein AB1758_23150 [Candidatus Eremiobacterota bacterium]
MKNTQTRRPLLPAWFAAMIVASLLITVAGTLRSIQPASPDEAVSGAAPADLLDVIWIDSYPEVTSDTWNAYLYSSDNVGIFIHAHSAYKLTLELFEFKAGDSAISFHFPHDGRRGKSNFSIEKMKKPTKHFDTQLTLAADPQNQGKNTVYFTGPEFRSLSTLPAPVRQALLNGPVMESQTGLRVNH